MDEALIGMRNRLNQDVIHFRLIVEELKAGNFQPKADTLDLMQRTLATLEQDLDNLNIRLRDSK